MNYLVFIIIIFRKDGFRRCRCYVNCLHLWQQIFKITVKKMSKLLIGGGTGFVGKYLKHNLISNGYDVTVISRKSGTKKITWDEIKRNGLPPQTSSVINLAGENVLDFSKRWTESFKKNVHDSRVNTTQILRDAIDNSTDKPKSFIVMSGVGIYPPSESDKYDEDYSVKEFDFLSKLCIDWESASILKKSSECRVINLRSGVVLGRNGGMINNLFLPFYFGAGGPIASGNQFLPWIHIQDLVNLIKFCIEKKNLSGILNAVAPNIITNKEFTQAFAGALNRPAFVPAPGFVFDALLGKERAIMITEGQAVLPKRTLESGYKYQYPDINPACASFAHLSFDKLK